jgi:hypothetical protein
MAWSFGVCKGADSLSGLIFEADKEVVEAFEAESF